MHCGRRRSHFRRVETQVWQSVRAKASELVPFGFGILEASEKNQIIIEVGTTSYEYSKESYRQVGCVSYTTVSR